MDYPKFIVSNQKEESISLQRVKMLVFTFQITQLKIDHNPFAKGFRDNGMGRRLVFSRTACTSCIECHVVF